MLSLPCLKASPPPSAQKAAPSKRSMTPSAHPTKTLLSTASKPFSNLSKSPPPPLKHSQPLQRFWTPPTFFFHPTVPTAQAETLTKAALRMGAAVTADEAAATHILAAGSPPPPVSFQRQGDFAEEAEIDFLSALELCEDLVFVHWHYLPYSYNEWIPRADVQVGGGGVLGLLVVFLLMCRLVSFFQGDDTIEYPPRCSKYTLVPPPPPCGDSNVQSVGFLVKSDEFNEWMDEDDFAVQFNDEKPQASLK